jgi:hypothetical protein
MKTQFTGVREDGFPHPLTGNLLRIGFYGHISRK